LGEIAAKKRQVGAATPSARRPERRKVDGSAARSADGAPGASQWTPPNVDGKLTTRLGGSLVDEFVTGHDVTDVLRELVQNEFDAEGSRLTIDFGQQALTVLGSGRAISPAGWKRLSVIVGTGRMIGDDSSGTIAAKTNGIGSKNFGLRSLFLFGDRIFVRSAGQVAVLDLPKLGTTRIPDNANYGRKGVSIHVEYRRQAFEKLQPFSIVEQERALDLMASDMLATLTKLALAGAKQGLRELTLRSEQLGRIVQWKQRAEKVSCRVPGVDVLRRVGRMSDEGPNRPTRHMRFEEIEFGRAIDIPVEFSGREIPGYFRRSQGRVRIAVSLPVDRRRVETKGAGRFFYPLQATHSRSGCSINVSAPFEVNSDRTALTPNNKWNEWLCQRAATLVGDLLQSDWFGRFGAAAYGALMPVGPAEPAIFVDALTAYLKAAPCWPTREGRSKPHFAKALDIFVATNDALDGHLTAAQYLHQQLGTDPKLWEMLQNAGIKAFTLNSLVRLRCAPKDAKSLATKPGEREGNLFFPNYVEALSRPERQVETAAALSVMFRQLTPSHKRDLRETESTLAADGALRPAKDLVIVDPSLWHVSPQPEAMRLHRDLASHRSIASLCRTFDEERWIRDACERATAGTVHQAERLALEACVLSKGATIGRRALAAIKRSPVLTDHRGAWTAAEDMVVLREPTAALFLKVLSGPSPALARIPDLLLKLRMRNAVNGHDVVKFAIRLSETPADAERFERFLDRNQQLLSSNIADRLSDIAFLRTANGTLAAPARLHLDTALNRVCLEPTLIVGGNSAALYRRLGVRELPRLSTLIEALETHVTQNAPPPRPEAFYVELAEAIVRERAQSSVAGWKLLWVRDGYYRPEDVLAGASIPRMFDAATPVVRTPDKIARAYLRIGARSHPEAAHWTRYFQRIGDRFGRSSRLPTTERQMLLEAYWLRGADALPESLDNSVPCLLDRRGNLYAPHDLDSGRYVANDFAAMADAVEAQDMGIGIIDVAERTRPFFNALGLRNLTSICGLGQTKFAGEAPGLAWFGTEQRVQLLNQIQQPGFASALHQLAGAYRRSTPIESAVPFEAFEARLASLRSLVVYDAIDREYRVGGTAICISVEVGMHEGILGLVQPRSKMDVHQLIGQALAELVGFDQIVESRLFAAALVPLLLCRSDRDIRVFLERQGLSIDHDASDEGEIDNGIEERTDLLEGAFTNIMNHLTVERPSEAPNPLPVPIVTPTPLSRTSEPTPSPSPFELPPLESVSPLLVPLSGSTIETRTAGVSRARGWGSSLWLPPSLEDVERDRKVGRRGEELAYALELDRVRALGFERPEDHVVWTSATDAGADHDIRSIDEAGRIIWIEVKATTGTDGRFDWPRREFEKAVAEGVRYELWRVYKAATRAPTIKRFPDPVRLLASQQLTLDLGTLKANIEQLD